MKLLTLSRRKRADARDGSGRLESALASAFAEGRWRVPDRFNFTRDVVEALATDPKREAVLCVGQDGVIEPRTFLQLSEGVARWATHLREHGVRPGDRVIVLVGKCLDWLEVMLAAIKVGAVTVPCPETLSAETLDIRIASSGARLIVAARTSEAELARTLERPPIVYVDDVRQLAHGKPPEAPTHDTSSRELAFVLSSSGTAGGPRGVSHTHGAAFAARVPAEHWLDAGPRDLVWSTEDTGAASAIWNVLLSPWSRGATVVLQEEAFDPVERLDLISRLGVTILCQTPAEYRALLETGVLARYRPHRLRRLVSTGDQLSPGLIAAFEEAWGLTIHDGYSQAETGIVAGHGPGAGFRSGSIGVPLPGFELAVIDESGNKLPPGIEGDLALKGRPPSLFAGYWDAPEETKATSRGDWYVTGDVAATDEDGYLWLLGRAHDVITSAGRRFGPTEVEEVLVSHAAVAEAAVVGMRDLERGGQFVRAFVVLRPEVDGSDRLVAEIREHVRQSLPDHQVPRELEFVDELPKTQNGKVCRLELRERPLAGTMTVWPAAPPPRWTLEPEPAPEPEAAPEPISGAVPEILPAEPAPAAEPVLEAPPAVAPAPEPEPPALEAEPAVELEPEPPAAIAESPALEPVAAPEPPAPMPEPPLEPAPQAPVDFEPVPWPEPGPAAVPEPEPPALEAEPAVELEPEPPALEAEPAAEPEPEPSATVAEARAPEPVAAEPTPPAEPEPLPDYIVVPPGSPEPVPKPESEPEPDLSAEPLPDYIVDPERPREARASESGPDEAEGEPEPADPLAGLSRPPVTELPAVSRDRASGDGETEGPATPKRPRPAVTSGRRPWRGRSSSDPGDEAEETTWMQGLSSRLSAYSLAEDGSTQTPASDDEEPAPDADEPA